MEKKRSSERTSYEVRRNWDEKNLKKYGVSFHTTKDADVIEYIETQKAAGKGTSEIFREAIYAIKK